MNLEKELQAGLNFAVLIDGDNVGARFADTIFSELNKYGFASVRRVYGNLNGSVGWQSNILLEYSITPVFRYSYAKGKNSTDMVMTVDAMELLYNSKVDAFCFVTSDCDFTPVVMHLREGNKYVIGMGESKTPAGLSKSCNKFIYLDLIQSSAEKDAEAAETPAEPSETESSITPLEKIEASVLLYLYEAPQQKLYLSIIGEKLSQEYPDFDVRNYGYTKLSTFVRSELHGLSVTKIDNMDSVEKKRSVSEDDLIAHIKAIVTAKDGKIDNLSVLDAELKKAIPHFDIKDYGVSKLSKFIAKRIDTLEVVDNSVRVKSKAPAPRKKAVTPKHG